MRAFASRLPSPPSLCLLFNLLGVFVLGECFQGLPRASPMLRVEGPGENRVSFLRDVPSDTQCPMLRGNV